MSVPRDSCLGIRKSMGLEPRLILEFFHKRVALGAMRVPEMCHCKCSVQEKVYWLAESCTSIIDY